ncbi:MAG: hypothetical protein OXU19_17340 [bacterium]|nr:hypothetical protein [bacterium]MDE0240361.1 hypothetical protein [bacterium]
MTRADVIRLIGSLLQEPDVRFEDEDAIFRALQAFRQTDADFVDALIVCKTLKVGSGDREAPVVCTFDAVALQLPPYCSAQGFAKERMKRPLFTIERRDSDLTFAH